MATTNPTARRTTTPNVAVSRRRALRAWLLWTIGFLAFPVAGVAGMTVAGRVDGPVAALFGGLATGAVVGLGVVTTDVVDMREDLRAK